MEGYRNGLIRSYHIQLVSDNTNTELNYTADGLHYIINNLRDRMYTCRIAAYTVGLGPYSDTVYITLGQSSTHRHVPWKSVAILSHGEYYSIV